MTSRFREDKEEKDESVKPDLKYAYNFDYESYPKVTSIPIFLIEIKINYSINIF